MMHAPPAGKQAPYRIAVATHQAAPDATPDDRLALDLLRSRNGLAVEPVPWDVPDVDWGRYDAVLIRSTWNYHRRLDAFLGWAEQVEDAGVLLCHPASVVRWNADKRYLCTLSEAGVAVVPTEWIPRGTVADLCAVLRLRGWRRAVVKPSVAATAYRTWIAGAGEPGAHQASLNALLADADAMVQPFLPQVQHAGEWSFIYFAEAGGRLAFSHAVVKRPVPGDFRVQSQFGGSVTSADPPHPLLRQVEAVAAVVTDVAPGPLLYARIDGVVSDGAYGAAGRFLLMEVELIEPNLYLGCAGHAPACFAEATANHFTAVEDRSSGTKGSR